MASYQNNNASPNPTKREDLGTSPSQGRQNISPEQSREKAFGKESKDGSMSGNPRNASGSAQTNP